MNDTLKYFMDGTLSGSVNMNISKTSWYLYVGDDPGKMISKYGNNE